MSRIPAGIILVTEEGKLKKYIKFFHRFLETFPFQASNLSPDALECTFLGFSSCTVPNLRASP
jgi:hypothetical protein